MSEQIELPAGAIVQDYEIQQRLGVGGFGIVYLAKHAMTGRRVAVKEFFPREFAMREPGSLRIRPLSEDGWFERGRAKFIETTLALRELSHPNIVQVYGIEEKNGTAYLVMEHIAGSTLREWRRDQNKVTAEKVQALVEPIISAIQYMHDREILHRDISPDNIMVDHDERPVLIDFGSLKLAAPQRPGTRSIAVFHPKYSPPEQSNADGEALTPPSEVYAVAATLYAMLIGRPPLAAAARIDALVAGDDPYPKLSDAVQARDAGRVDDVIQSMPRDLSLRVAHAIDLGLRMRREDRPQTIRALLDALGWGDGADAPDPSLALLTAVRAETAARTSRDETRAAPRWRIAVAVMGVLGAAVAVAWALTMS